MSVATCCTHFLFAQSAEVIKIRQYRQANEHQLISNFVSFLSIPNIVGDSVNIRRNADYIMQAMNAKGIQNIQLLYPTTAKSVPALIQRLIQP